MVEPAAAFDAVNTYRARTGTLLTHTLEQDCQDIPARTDDKLSVRTGPVLAAAVQCSAVPCEGSHPLLCTQAHIGLQGSLPRCDHHCAAVLTCRRGRAGGAAACPCRSSAAQSVPQSRQGLQAGGGGQCSGAVTHFTQRSAGAALPCTAGSGCMLGFACQAKGASCLTVVPGHEGGVLR